MLKINEIKKSFGKKAVLKGISAKFPQGKTTVIVGPSGSGKTTLLRSLDMLVTPDSGTLDFDDLHLDFAKPISNKENKELRDKTSMVFQNWNLFHNLTILKNITASPIFVHHVAKEQAETNAHNLLKEVGLDEYADAYPDELSGGQQQRVAIARALANDPKILISDEATSALDPENTNQILDLLKDLNQKRGLTVILITHEMDAIKRICDQVAIMDAGKVVDLGSLIDVFVKSTNPVTRKIVGEDFDAFSILKSLNIDTKNRHLVKLIYFSQEISKPIIIELYSKFQIAASIVYADIEKFRDEAVGIMIVDLNGEETQRKQAIEYLQNLDIEVSELRGEA